MKQKLTNSEIIQLDKSIGLIMKSDCLPWKVSWKLGLIIKTIEGPMLAISKASSALAKKFAIITRDDKGQEREIIPANKREAFREEEDQLMAEGLELNLPTFTMDELEDADRQMKELAKKGIPPIFISAIQPLIENQEPVK